MDGKFALVVQQGGIDIATADESGIIAYAEGHSAESVMTALASAGVDLLSRMLPSANCVSYGLVLDVGHDEDLRVHMSTSMPDAIATKKAADDVAHTRMNAVNSLKQD
jgi:hypothetical protein